MKYCVLTHFANLTQNCQNLAFLVFFLHFPISNSIVKEHPGFQSRTIRPLNQLLGHGRYTESTRKVHGKGWMDNMAVAGVPGPEIGSYKLYSARGVYVGG